MRVRCCRRISGRRIHVRRAHRRARTGSDLTEQFRLARVARPTLVATPQMVAMGTSFRRMSDTSISGQDRHRRHRRRPDAAVRGQAAGRGAWRARRHPGGVRRQPAHRRRDPAGGRGRVPRGGAGLLPSLGTGCGRRVRQVRTGDGVLPGARERRLDPRRRRRRARAPAGRRIRRRQDRRGRLLLRRTRLVPRRGAARARRVASASTAAASSPVGSRSSPRWSSEVASLQTPWLGLFGDQDGSIPVEDVEAAARRARQSHGRHRDRALRRSGPRFPLRPTARLPRRRRGRRLAPRARLVRHPPA